MYISLIHDLYIALCATTQSQTSSVIMYLPHFPLYCPLTPFPLVVTFFIAGGTSIFSLPLSLFFLDEIMHVHSSKYYYCAGDFPTNILAEMSPLISKFLTFMSVWPSNRHLHMNIPKSRLTDSDFCSHLGFPACSVFSVFVKAFAFTQGIKPGA